MSYLQCKQIAQYAEGWQCYLAPERPTPLTAAELLDPALVLAHGVSVAAWQASYDDWRIKDNMALGAIKGTLRSQYLTSVLSCTTSKAAWDAILASHRTQNLGLAAHNTKQLLYHHPYLGGSLKNTSGISLSRMSNSHASARHFQIQMLRIGCLKTCRRMILVGDLSLAVSIRYTQILMQSPPFKRVLRFITTTINLRRHLPPRLLLTLRLHLRVHLQLIMVAPRIARVVPTAVAARSRVIQWTIASI